MAERERQELAVELARQAEENKRLRKSLLIQSDKFVKLRQSTSLTDVPPSASSDHRLTPVTFNFVDGFFRGHASRLLRLGIPATILAQFEQNTANVEDNAISPRQPWHSSTSNIQSWLTRSFVDRAF